MKPKRSHTATGCPCCQEPDSQDAKRSKRRKPAETSTEAELTLPTSSRHLDAVPLVIDPIPTPTAIQPPPIPVHPIQPPPQILPLHHSSSSSEAGSDDEEAIPESGLQHIISNHVKALTGNGYQFASPISTPILSQVKPSICKDIWKGKFIDLASLLLSSMPSAPTQFMLQMDHNSNINLAPSARPRRLNTIESWTSAFLRFVAIYSVKFPEETPKLIKYAEIVRDLAARRPGSAFLLYDNQFRMLRETIPLPWDQLHTEFWLMASTSMPQPPQSFLSSRQSRPARHRHQFLENTCWPYNLQRCKSSACPRHHVCGFCRGSHTYTHCSYSSKEDALRTLGSRPKPAQGAKPSKP